jgi:hypothetical protein
MKRFTFVFLLLINLICSLEAGNVEESIAEKVAKNHYWLYSSGEVNYNQLSIKLVYTEKDNNLPVYYIFNVNSNDGFVIVAAEDNVYPILGYSYNGKFVGDMSGQAPAFKWWMSNYVKEIVYVRDNDVQASEEITYQWNELLQNPDKQLDVKGVNPLLTTTWNQGCYYNFKCPEDASGPCGHVYTGCVATAMAQIMKYHNYPVHGEGSYSYNCPGYGTLSADFKNTTYDWMSMPDNVTNVNNAVATIMYHAGVSVDMQYGTSSSSSTELKAYNAFLDYFNYSEQAQIISKVFFPTTTWENIIKESLDNSLPVFYSGTNDDKNKEVYGHAFVCDGYQGTNYFHFNWGWSGSADGFYYLTNLNPNGYDFTSNQSAIVNLFPKYSEKLNPPEELDAFVDGNNVMLTWNDPIEEYTSNWIHWDKGYSTNGIGLASGGTFYASSHWTPSDLTPYDDMYLTKISFYPSGNSSSISTFTINVWKGQNGSTDLLVSQPVTVVFGVWNTVDLTTPVKIDASKDLWFGYKVVQAAGESPAGCDDGPAEKTKGDMLSVDGNNWVSIYNHYGMNKNFSIQGYVDVSSTLPEAVPMTKNQESSKYLSADDLFIKNIAVNEQNLFNPTGKVVTGFNVYRNDVFLDFVMSNGYIDYDVPDGSYNYCVTAVYTEGESPEECIDVDVGEIIKPPLNVTATVMGDNVSVNWLEPGSIPSQSIEWDDGVNFYSLGLVDGGSFFAASHWMPADLVDYDGMYLSFISVYISDDPGTNITIKVWEGENAATELVSQEVKPVPNSWNTVQLDTPVEIDASKELWFGYKVTHDANLTPAGIDDGPAIPYKGDLLSKNGTQWFSLFEDTEVDGNWNIAGYISNSITSKTAQPMVKEIIPNPAIGKLVMSDKINRSPSKNREKELTGYNVYRNDEFLANVTETTYLDQEVAEGPYTYCVDAVYDGGASEKVCAETVYVGNEEFFSPENLKGPDIINFGDTVTLSWDAPLDNYNIHWDDGINLDAIGLGENGTFFAASRWTPQDLEIYDSMFINKIVFYCSKFFVSTPDFTIKVWEGTNAETELVSQPYEPKVGWNEVVLTTPVLIDANKELWFGYMVTVTNMDYPAGCDDGPAIKYKGDLFSVDGFDWYPMSELGEDLNINWNLSAIISKSADGKIAVPIKKEIINPSLNIEDITLIKKATTPAQYVSDELKTFKNYNVYRNGSLIGTTDETSYKDCHYTEAGRNSYYVTAKYVSGESEPSNTIETYVNPILHPYDVNATVDDKNILITWRSPYSTMSSFYDGFERGDLDSWGRLIEGDGDPGDFGLPYWYVCNCDPYEGYYTAVCDWGYFINSWLVTPPINVEDDFEIYFNWNASYYWNVYPNDNGDLFVKISTDNGLTWTTLWTFGDILNWEDWVWYETTLDISDYAGQTVLIAFNNVGNNNSDVFLDNVDIRKSTSKVTGTYAISSAPVTDKKSKHPPKGYVYDFKNTKGLIGYNVYKNDEFLAYVTDTSYWDNNVSNGVYNYCVSAVYDESIESDEVCAEMPVAIYDGLYSPINLTGPDVINWSDTVRLSWDPPEDDFYIRWDNGINFVGIGLNDGGTFWAASHWTPQDLVMYDSMFLQKIVFYAIVQPGRSSSFVIKVWEGVNASTELVSQNVNVKDGWNEITLTTPVLIDASKELWFGYKVTHAAGEFPAGGDFGPALKYKGDMISYDGNEWSSLAVTYPDLDYNWNLTALVSKTVNGKVATPLKKEIVKPSLNVDYKLSCVKNPEPSEYSPPKAKSLKYNIYRDLFFIGSTTENYYDDTDCYTCGVINYSVTAVYDEGESQPSNSIEVNVLPRPPYPTPNNVNAVVSGNDVLVTWQSPYVQKAGFCDDFETGNLNYWKELEKGEGTPGESGYTFWHIAEFFSYQNNYISLSNWAYNLNTSLISTPITVGDNYILYFNWVSSYYWNVYPNDNGDLFVKISTDNGNTWTKLWTFGEIGEWEDWVWYGTLIDLSAYEGQTVLLAINNVGNDNSDVCIDNVIVERWINQTVGTYALSSKPVVDKTLKKLPDNYAFDVKNTKEVSGYKIYRNNEFVTVVTDTSYRDNNVEDGNYTYCITALYDDGESDQLCANEVSVGIEFNPPQNVTATVSGNDVTVTWEAPAGKDLTGYNVYRNGILLTLVTETTYYDSDLESGTYTYCVSAVYDSGESTQECASEVTIEPELLPPVNLNGPEQVELGEPIDLTWDSPGSEVPNYYLVYRNDEDIASTTETFYNDSEYGNTGVYEYYVTAVYDFGESEPSNTIIVNVITGVDEKNSTMLKVYPIPAVNYINIKSKLNILSIEMINMEGQIVMKQDVNMNNYKIKISKLYSGVYLLKINTNENIFIKRIFIERK